VGGYSAVSDVSNELVDVLEAGMTDPGPPEVDILDGGEVGLASPDDPGTLRLTVYLYRLSESDHSKNAERVPVGAGRDRAPPLTLDLYYLLTAHPSAGSGGSNGTEDPQIILGRAMQVLYDRPVIEAPGSGEEAYVSIHPQSMEEVADVWNSFGNESLLPSVTYLVTPVVIESATDEPVRRVVERRIGPSGSEEVNGS
jgi:hypothetical protein